MAVTQQQIDQEAKDEAKFNAIQEQILSYTGAWAKFYPIIRAASKAGEGAINHKVCLDKDGRSIIVYNTTAGRVVGTWLKPTHEYISKYLSRKEYGKAALSALGWGAGLAAKEMKAAKCIAFTPNEILRAEKKHEARLKREAEIAAKRTRSLNVAAYSLGGLALAGIVYGIVVVSKNRSVES